MIPEVHPAGRDLRHASPIEDPGHLQPSPMAYIMSRFPRLTETFILRELLELERQGQPLAIFPLLRVQQAVRHREARPLMPKVLYTSYLTPAIFSANFHYLRRSPRRYLETLWMVLKGTWGSSNLFLGAVAVFPKSVYLARLIEAQGIKHVHAHFATHPTLAALIISELTEVGFSFTAHAHDIFVRTKILDKKIEKARFVVAISEFNKQYLLRLCAQTPEDKIKVIHCGVESARYLTRRSSVLNKEGRFRVLSIASLQPYKGIEYLVKACALLRAEVPDFRCLIIGEGEDRKRIQRLIGRLGLERIVLLLGARPHHEVIPLLAEADLFVLPSVVAPDGQMEGIPVALMEAMASGLPVVATRLSGIPELVDDGVSGVLVPPGNERALADAISFLYHREPLRRMLGRSGREKVVAEFELMDNVRKLRSLFSEAHDRASVTQARSA
ncbi:MAG: glycosyltransferase [Acidobacteria bacterium]|nr:glycosyltransferase [Acidobacteriota bacterium]